MLQPALTPVVTGHHRPPTTYGDMLAAAADRVAEAIHGARSGPTRDIAAATAEFHGYARFLRIAGIHLDLLASLTGMQESTLGRLSRRLSGAPSVPAGDSLWNRAATTLGAAHDLVSTHLGPNRLPLTPDAAEWLPGQASLGAAHDLTMLVSAVFDASTAVSRRVSRAQQNMSNRPVSVVMFNRLHGLVHSAKVYTKATLWELRDHSLQSGAPGLAALAPAETVIEPGTPSQPFESALEAMAALRQLAFAQARGTQPASPASLRDLALIGARLHDPTIPWAPAAATGLDRIRRANARDRIGAAHDAWLAASEGLTQHIQGITKAPATYGAAVRTLLDTDQLTPQVQVALASALPRLGRDAAAAVLHLAVRGDLVTPQRVPCQPRVAWMPIPYELAAEVASRFTAASQASSTGLTAMRDLRPRTSYNPAAPTEALSVHRALSRGRGLSR